MNRFMNPGLLGQPAQPFRQVSPLQALLGGGEEMMQQAMPQQAMQPAMNPTQNRMSGLREMLPDLMIGLGAGLASGNPGATAAIFQQQLADKRQTRQQSQTANATKQWLQSQGMDDLLPLVDANMAQEALRMAMERRKQPDMPSAVREYEYARQNGFQGSFADWKQAGRQSVTVNNDLRSENKFDETLGKELATEYLTIQKEGATARGAIATLDQMKKLVAEPGFYSGAGGESVLAAKRLGQAIGLDPEGIDSMETFNALSKQSALAVMGGSLGAGFSNADRDFVLGQVANLGNTPEGNVRLIEVQKRMAQQKVKIQEFANQYARQNGGRLDSNFYIALEQWANSQPPIFSDMMGGGRQPMTADDLRNMTDQQLQEFINGR